LGRQALWQHAFASEHHVIAHLPYHRLVRWKVYADAGWFLDIPGFGPAAGTRPMRGIATTLQTAYNASFDAACMSQLLPGQVSTMLAAGP
jgi:hypothetical protein